MIDHIPQVLLNTITQFLTDLDNHQFMQCCSAIRHVVRALPRLSEFRLTDRARDMYGRYRSVHICIDNTISTGNHHKFSKNGKTWKGFHLLRDIPIGDIYSIKWSCKSYTKIFIHQLKQLPVFPNIRELDVSAWAGFEIFQKFPNITTLKMTFLEKITKIFPYYERCVNDYPKFPELKTLIVTNRGVDKCYDPMRKVEFPVWPSVTHIETTHCIPVGYINLRSVWVSNPMCIPLELASKLHSITTHIDLQLPFELDPNRIWHGRFLHGYVLKFNNCPNLQNLNILDRRKYNQDILIYCSKKFKIYHTLVDNVFLKIV